MSLIFYSFFTNIPFVICEVNTGSVLLHKSVGPDGISYKILTELPNCLPAVLTTIISLSQFIIAPRCNLTSRK